MNIFGFHNMTVHYRVSGEGSPVLLLHGFLEDHTIWDQIAPELVQLGFKVYVVDLPCHGKSRYNGETCSMESMAEMLNVFCTELGIQNPFVFGHSMGGYVGLELLRKRPIQLTLLHSNFWSDSVEKQNDRNRVVQIVEENKMRLINEAIPHLFSLENRENCKQAITELISKASSIPSNEIIASTKGMRDRKDHTALMNAHDISLIHGDLDEIVKTEQLDVALEKLENQPTVYRFKNCGHMSIWEDPEQLINSIKLIVFR